MFKEYRKQDDFLYTDVIAFDIDNGQTIEEAEKAVHRLDISCLCLPSTSHSPELHKFRLIFPLVRSIRNSEEYKTTYSKLAEHFNVDPACKDLARFYYGSKMIDGFWYESKLLEPTVAEKPKKVDLKRFAHKHNVVVGESLEELTITLFDEKRDKIPDNVAYFLENAADGMSGEMYHRSNSFLFTCGLMGCKQENIEAVFYELYPYEVTTKVKYMVDKIIKEGYTAREEL